MNDCGAKSKLSAPLIYLSKTGNYSLIEGVAIFSSALFCASFFPLALFTARPRILVASVFTRA